MVDTLNGSGPSMIMAEGTELHVADEGLLHVQRLAGIGTLTASVAHELTNPISIIMAACANLRDDMESGELTPEQLARTIDLIEQSAYRSARIVDVLRRYSHSEGDSLNLAITSPAEIVADALTMVEQQFRKRAKVTIETEVQPGVQSIVCDHNRIVQVLVNLLLNARDAMSPNGGVIGICFRPTGASDQFAAAPGEDSFAFSVTDRGAGIAPETMTHLFDPFYTTKPSGAGVGLGLYIAQGIIREHRGRIQVENNPGGGATFTVIMPKRQ